MRRRLVCLFIICLVAEAAVYVAHSDEAPLAMTVSHMSTMPGRYVTGTTYSHRQSQYLAIDENQAYLSTLDMGFPIIRLAAYWDEIEKSEDHYDFRRLDWQIAEAKKRGVPIVLSVGMKVPRWPEFFIPDWVMKRTYAPYGTELTEHNPFLRERTLKFIRTVMMRYREEGMIRYWQVENEPLDRSGDQFWWIKKEFVRQEVDIVRTLDPKHRPVIMTVATYPNRFVRSMFKLFALNKPLPETMELGDIVGINVYHAIGQKFGRFKFYFWIHPEERARYYSAVRAMAGQHGKEVWITELQAEPWEPGQLAYTGKDMPPSANPSDSKKVLEEFRSLGFGTVFFWGAEYWHFRKSHLDDPRWADMVLDVLREKAGT